MLWRCICLGFFICGVDVVLGCRRHVLEYIAMLRIRLIGLVEGWMPPARGLGVD